MYEGCTMLELYTIKLRTGLCHVIFFFMLIVKSNGVARRRRSAETSKVYSWQLSTCMNFGHHNVSS